MASENDPREQSTLSEPVPLELSDRMTLWHYTTASNLEAILRSMRLNPSVRADNPRDARFGDGQYLSDIRPGTRASTQLAYEFVRRPEASSRFTHYLEVDVTGLKVIRARGRRHVLLILGRKPLDLTGRAVSWGSNWSGISR